jgi:NADP-dependent 3-hydroxy acid dehydrogenase YdfG
MQLNGKRVWITGASSGIGAATARVLASEGAEMVLSARRPERIQSLAEEISEQGGKAFVRPFDLTDRASAARVGKELETLGGVDVLVNNAGIMPLAPMLACRIDEWDKMIDINIKGLLYTIHAVLPGMSERRRGHIVNVSSVAAKFAFAGGAVYSGTKFAVRGITDGLRREALHYGVHVSSVEPGAVATEIPDGKTYDETRSAVKVEGSFSASAEKRLQNVDVARAILYVITQPDHVTIGELLLRPAAQEF